MTAQSQALRELKREGWARRAELTTAHGKIQTPAFMPVGTYGAVKTLAPTELAEAGTQILLGNTYHLFLRPGLEVLSRFGGLHRFMGWNGPILTDSGGFQVFSLGRLKEISDEGVRFQSHLNGDMVHLTPERAAEIQQAIGSDIAMILDECVALPSPREKIRESVERSLQWTARFLRVPRRPGQLVFGIGQGGTELDLRKESLERTLEFPIDGIALGGLSVGEPHEAMMEILEGLAPSLPGHLPHYLMGVGTPLDLLEGVARGIDLFDCVLPTRNARNGGLFTDQGLLNIRNSEHRLSEKPVSEDCSCPLCRQFSRAYLRHLFQTKEILGCRLATLHNLHYYHAFMFRMRSALEAGEFADLYGKWLPRLRLAYGGKREDTFVGDGADVVSIG